VNEDDFDLTIPDAGTKKSDNLFLHILYNTAEIPTVE
jgi:hypothetical protein